MQFDVIIGNPPYQLDNSGNGRSAKPLYDKFVQQGINFNPRYVCMIIPSRWFGGNNNTGELCELMLNDKHISKIVDFIDSKDCFPGVIIAGGVCYFLWDKNHTGDTHVTNHIQERVFEARRRLNEFKSFVRLSPSVPILRKILNKGLQNLSHIISSRKPFGLATSERGCSEGELTLVSSAGISKISTIKITSGYKYIDKWKVITSQVGDSGGRGNKEGKRRVLSTIQVVEPNVVCTDSYIVLGAFDNEQQAINLKNYAETRVFRFLLSLLALTQHIGSQVFKYVPLLDFSQNWNDEKLCAYFHIDNEEFDFICSLIRPYRLSA